MNKNDQIFLRRSFLLPLFALLILSSPAQSSDFNCNSLGLPDIELSSVSSAAWVNGQAVVTDPVGKQVVALQIQNDRLASSRRIVTDNEKPYFGFAVGSGYTQVGRGFDLEWFDHGLRTLDRKSKGRLVRAREGNTGYRLLAMFDHATVADRIVVYGVAEDLSIGDPDPARLDKYVYGFYEVGFQPPDGVTSGAELIQLHAEGPDHWYTYGHSYIAAVGNNVYFVVLDGYPALYRYSRLEGGQADYVSGLPGEDEKLPVNVIPADRPNVAELYQQIADAPDLPVGLYSKGPFLYSLHRNGEAGTWDFVQLRPGRHEVVEIDRYTIRPPNGGSHLTLTPTPGFWLLFEKGDVAPDGTQPLLSIQKCNFQGP